MKISKLKEFKIVKGSEAGVTEEEKNRAAPHFFPDKILRLQFLKKIWTLGFYTLPTPQKCVSNFSVIRVRFSSVFFSTDPAPALKDCSFLRIRGTGLDPERNYHPKAVVCVGSGSRIRFRIRFFFLVGQIRLRLRCTAAWENQMRWSLFVFSKLLRDSRATPSGGFSFQVREAAKKFFL